MTGSPLEGVLVADFSRVLAGPLATMTLADLGADVVVRRGEDVAASIRRHFPDGVDALADGSVQRTQVLGAVRDLKREGMTMVIATHEMSFAREVADEVAFLHEGKLVESGPPAKVLGEPERPETRRFLSRLLEAGRI